MMPKLYSFATLGLLVTQSAAATLRRWDSEEPFYDQDPNVPSGCTLWWNTDDGLSCETALRIAGVSVDDLLALNPSMKSCQDWKADRSYCIKGSSTPAPVTTPAPVPSPTVPTTTATTTTTSSPTRPDNGIKTPDPFQPGMVENCNRFHLVSAGEVCSDVANKAGITVAQLAAWNSQIGGTDCRSLWTGYHVCTGVVGGSATVPPPPNHTPQPIQDGMVDNCNRFHLVTDEDNCWSLANKYGLTEASLQQWNKGIGGAACANMWTGYYLCIGISGDSQTRPPPPPSTTPQPVQDGMVANCKKFHFVQGGEYCDGIARQHGVSLADFLRWNPAAGSSCQGLWANTYTCVGL